MMLNALSRAGLCLALIFAFAPAGAHDLHVAAPAKPASELTYARAAEIGHAIVTAEAQATYTEYTGDEARKLIGVMNAVEPVSHWTADRIVVIDPDGEQPFRVGVVEADCVTHAFPVPRAVWSEIVPTALGTKS